MTDSLKHEFLLDPDVIFLNHGSFGACPRPVFEVYQEWQRRLERQPVQFLNRELKPHLRHVREALGNYLHTDADDLVPVPNATFGVNVVARSLDLQPGDQVLATDHEYGACDRTWRFICQKRGVEYVRQAICLPVQSHAEIIDQIWQGVTPRTKVIFVSHITSPSALIFPVVEICRRAREVGILTVVDGAHAPGQVEVDLQAIDPDFYSGNCHKWLCAPKGSGFLYARRDRQPLLEPLVVSWGWEAENTVDSTFIEHHEWWGTRDPAAYLAIPAAIAFQERHNWPEVRKACHEMAREALARITHMTGQPSIYGDDSLYAQMVAVPTPIRDPASFQQQMYDEYRVEVPLTHCQEQRFVRVSVQAYNAWRDLEVLVEALSDLLPQHVTHARNAVSDF